MGLVCRCLFCCECESECSSFYGTNTTVIRVFCFAGVVPRATSRRGLWSEYTRTVIYSNTLRTHTRPYMSTSDPPTTLRHTSAPLLLHDPKVGDDGRDDEEDEEQAAGGGGEEERRDLDIGGGGDHGRHRLRVTTEQGERAVSCGWEASAMGVARRWRDGSGRGARIPAGGGSGDRLRTPWPMTACCVCRGRHRQCPDSLLLARSRSQPSQRGGLSGQP